MDNSSSEVVLVGGVCVCLLKKIRPIKYDDTNATRKIKVWLSLSNVYCHFDFM